MRRSLARSGSWPRVLFFAALLTGAMAGSSVAQGKAFPPSVNSLVSRVIEIEARIGELEQLLAAQALRISALETENQTQAAALAALGAVVAAHGEKLAPVTREDGVGTGTEWTLTGVNLNVRNGLGSTAGIPFFDATTGDPVTNGLGNIVIGYNEASDIIGGDRTGSHNLVLGLRNTYESIGGLVGGTDNRIAGPLSSVLSGSQSSADGRASVILTGHRNQTKDRWGVVATGAFNTAGDNGMVVSGTHNVTTFRQGVIISGHGNTADLGGVVVYGNSNEAGGGVIVSGYSNRILPAPVPGTPFTEATAGAILGGEDNLISAGRAPVVVGGHDQIATTDHQIVP